MDRIDDAAPAPAPAPQKFVSAQTWALARRDYLAGETAAVVAERYGIGIDNLRKRQINEGWTRKAQRAALGDGPWPDEEARLAAARGELDAAMVGARCAADQAGAAKLRFDLGMSWHPARAMSQAAAEASRLIAEGRGREAQAVIRAAESLGRLTGYRPVPQEHYAKDLYGQEAELLTWYRVYEAEVRSQARWIASAALGEDPAAVDEVKPWRRGFAFPWRAQVLGEAAARADFEHFRAEPWAADVWDEDGRLRPEEEIDARSLRRHRDEWRAAVGLPTDPALWAEADVAARVFPKEVPVTAQTRPGWVTE